MDRAQCVRAGISDVDTQRPPGGRDRDGIGDGESVARGTGAGDACFCFVG